MTNAHKMTHLLLSSSMVVVISLCSSSSNLLFWDLFLNQRTETQLGHRLRKQSLIGEDAAEPDEVTKVPLVHLLRGQFR